MSQAMYKKLKKQNGEKFAQTVRNFHSGLLEIPELDVILRHAGRNAQPLLPYLMTLMASNDDEEVAPSEPQDPFELLDQAGYDAFHADTLKKQNSIKPYFRKGELLCTFNDKARYKDYHIVHAIKKNVDEIEPADIPGREDEYGTSVISIQMVKDGGFISIKNRYNHSVLGCDNTFNSNPDNIVFGLSAALKNHFNIDFAQSKVSLPNGYRSVDGQVFKYNNYTDGIYYGNQAWICNDKIHRVDRSGGDALFENYLFDNKEKILKTVYPGFLDSFIEDFNRIYGGNQGLNVQKGNLTLDGKILIGAERSAITSLYLPGMTSLGNNSLSKLPALKEFNAPDMTHMGYRSLSNVRAMETFIAPALMRMKYGSLQDVTSLREFDAPALTYLGMRCLDEAYSLTRVNLPSLIEMGDYCLSLVQSLQEFNAPSLTMMGYSCFYNAESLKKFDAPKLAEVDDMCFVNVPKLKEFNVPALNRMKALALEYAPKSTRRSVRHLLDPQWVQNIRLRFEAREFTPIVEYTPHI